MCQALCLVLSIQGWKRQTRSLTSQICALWLIFHSYYLKQKNGDFFIKERSGSMVFLLSFFLWGSFLSLHESYKTTLECISCWTYRLNLFFPSGFQAVNNYSIRKIWCFLCFFLLFGPPIQSTDQSKLPLHLDPSLSSGCIFFFSDLVNFQLPCYPNWSFLNPSLYYTLAYSICKARLIILKNSFDFFLMVLLNKDETS